MKEREEGIWQIEWIHGSADIHTQGGMLGPVRFRLPNRREFQPMHVTNWEGQHFDPKATGGFSGLYGEWPCVPFGSHSARADLPAGWKPKETDDNGFFHGFASHHMWQLHEVRAGYIALNIVYPEQSPIDSLRREIEGDLNGPALSVSLRIRVRSEVQIPIALHSTFRVPETGLVRILGGDAEQVISYPWPLEPAVCRLKPNTRSQCLSNVEGLHGPVDLSNLPLPFSAEELVQMVDCAAPIHLHYVSEGALVSLDWDRRVLPDALLWISNGGRSEAPWNGRHFAIGVEPIAGPFDFGGIAIPESNYPLANRLLRLTPGRETVIRYMISAHLASDFFYESK